MHGAASFFFGAGQKKKNSGQGGATVNLRAFSKRGSLENFLVWGDQGPLFFPGRGGAYIPTWHSWYGKGGCKGSAANFGLKPIFCFGAEKLFPNSGHVLIST